MRWKKRPIAWRVAAGVSYFPRRARQRVHADAERGHAALHAGSLPGMSITKAAEVLQTQDKIIKSFPKSSSVFGKAGAPTRRPTRRRRRCSRR
jgi:Cu(I)/Ag(I) efflux system membrane protein CusA/SilA